MIVYSGLSDTVYKPHRLCDNVPKPMLPKTSYRSLKTIISQKFP